jgi:sortase A
MHRVLRVISIMLITAGLVVMADAGLTLVWEEPLSAAYGAFKQGQAEDQLNKLETQYPTPEDLAAIAGVRGIEKKARILADRFEPHLQEGHAIGRIKIDRIGLSIVVVQGTDTSSLQKGPGHYRNTPVTAPPTWPPSATSIRSRTATRSGSRCPTRPSPTPWRSTRSSTQATWGSSSPSVTTAWS